MSKKPTNLFEKIFHAVRMIFEDSSQKWSETEFIFTLEKSPRRSDDGCRWGSAYIHVSTVINQFFENVEVAGVGSVM